MSIIYAGLVMMVYLGCVVICFFVTSDMVETLISSFESVGASEGVSLMPTVGTLLRAAYNMAFALAGLVPVVWFIFWAYHREPQDFYYD